MTKMALAGLLAAALLGALALGASSWVFHATSEPEFCIRCHEMRTLAEQGWMRSPHYQNPSGVVAGCADCHIPPELVHMVWAKTRDGLWDVWVHAFGEADPHQMDWEHLEQVARSKIADSSCRRCHENITPKGASIKMLIAHRAYQRMEDRKRCVDCHRTEFHGGFRDYLFPDRLTRRQGGRP